ncbi:MAG: ATP-grasp domain-containing protein [Candidatus Buchananbacteria bacterium]|nr:ATP-grasp domain-containing protein [Candidatus Buchananbacteria bacterium]
MATNKEQLTIKDKDRDKDIILFVGRINNDHVASVRDLEELLDRKLKIGLITTQNKKMSPEMEKKIDILIRCDMNKLNNIEDAVMKYRDKVLALMAKPEFSIELLTRVAPLFPYLRLSRNRSLRISNDKLEMRKTFRRYYPKISPKFIHVKKYSEAIIKQIIKDIGFPCVIKPTNLSGSKLIINCFYKEELEKNLKDAMRKINSLVKKASVVTVPKIIVEEFMEGQMYSIDAYVNTYGKMYYTPIIEIKTGKDAGYDDLFMYTQIAPSILSKEEEKKAQDVVNKGTHAIGLKSSTVHCELMKTSKGWKIIELAGRPGGFRDEIFYHAFGFKHHLNDLLIHIGNKPIIKKKAKKHVVFMKFWPHKPGKIVAIKGLKKGKELKSLVRFRQNKKVGDYAGRSKHGHLSVVGFTLATKTRADLLGDIRKLEKWIKIETVKRNGKVKKTKKKI